MARSNATTVAAYLKSLPVDQRKVIAKLRRLIRKNLPKGYEEAMHWGVISYQVPLKTYANTYNKQPLMYAGIGAHKNYNTLYLMRPYGDPKQLKILEESFAKAGKKLDLGKSCIRFRTVDDLPLPAIATLVASTPAANWISIAEVTSVKIRPTVRERR
jgi:hypothetical protein